MKQINEVMLEAYSPTGPAISFGGIVHENEVLNGIQLALPLATFNRHGLIAGATGTGKTKTLQGIAESLSTAGVPCLLMDVKGDLSGLAASGGPNPKIEARQQKINMPWQPVAFPVELFTLSNEKGVRLRATVSEFGPVLFSRILDLNDTQSGVVAMVFQYCDDHLLPLLDLKDFRKTLQYLTKEGKGEVEEHYGTISKATTSTIIRKILELEQQQADVFFGERSFDVADLVRLDANGKGYLSIIRLTDIQDNPKLFSTFMLSLLAEIFSTFPEAGDLEKPKLMIFIDEAHLVFAEASKALLQQLDAVVKLIRSKGVGIVFCTQQPTDIPENILSQLGLKVQHALRTFTAKDRKNLKLVAENYPLSDYYDTEQLLTTLGIGEAVMTGLNAKGVPTPLAHVMLKAPASRMDVLSDEEINTLVSKSTLVPKYNTAVDRESAFEILTAKLHRAQSVPKETPAANKPARTTKKSEKTLMEEVTGTVAGRQVMRTVAREVVRGLFGVLGIKTR